MTVVVAETARLLLRRLEIADAAFMCRLFNEPSWLQNIGDRGVRTTQDAEHYIRTKTWETYQRLGFGMYLVESKAEACAIGLCGLVSREALPDPDIGFAMLPGFWGRGYAFEAAHAVMAHARALGFARLLAVVSPGNERSSRLLEKLGFALEGAVRLTPEGEELKLFAAGEPSAR